MPKEPQPLNCEAIPVFPNRLVILNEDRIIYNFKRLAKLNLKLFLLPEIYVEASNVINDPKCNKGPKCNNVWP